MIKDLKYGWESLKLSWQRMALVHCFAFSAIYENTLFPFIKFFLARLLDT